MPEAPKTNEIGIARTKVQLRDQIAAWRAEGFSVAFVPTMGALHSGHLSLVEMARSKAPKTVTSIFVNPTQFAPHEDLQSYPRHEADDLRKLTEVGCDLVYLPDVESIYPADFQTSVHVEKLTHSLCGSSRPHFFGGVATVVCKLLNQVRPDVAVFGEKDFQQLLVIRRMVRDLDLDIEIVGAPIVRETDGLALSSRNAYLSSEERRIAGQLNKVIALVATQLAAGENVSTAIQDAHASLLQKGFLSVDYLEVRSEDDLDLQGPGPVEKKSRVFVAVKLGRTRLIDNWSIGS